VRSQKEPIVLLTLSDFCSSIVARFDKSWGYLGWVLWGGWLLAPYFLAPYGATLWVGWLIMSVLLLLWWVCDAFDQQLAWWQMLVGLFMLGIGYLPRGGILAIACWILYWTRVRD
jgi:hypothetical protein